MIPLHEVENSSQKRRQSQGKSSLPWYLQDAESSENVEENIQRENIQRVAAVPFTGSFDFDEDESDEVEGQKEISNDSNINVQDLLAEPTDISASENTISNQGQNSYIEETPINNSSSDTVVSFTDSVSLPNSDATHQRMIHLGSYDYIADSFHDKSSHDSFKNTNLKTTQKQQNHSADNIAVPTVNSFPSFQGSFCLPNEDCSDPTDVVSFQSTTSSSVHVYTHLIYTSMLFKLSLIVFPAIFYFFWKKRNTSVIKSSKGMKRKGRKKKKRKVAKENDNTIISKKRKSTPVGSDVSAPKTKLLNSTIASEEQEKNSKSDVSASDSICTIKSNLCPTSQTTENESSNDPHDNVDNDHPVLIPEENSDSLNTNTITSIAMLSPCIESPHGNLQDSNTELEPMFSSDPTTPPKSIKRSIEIERSICKSPPRTRRKTSMRKMNRKDSTPLESMLAQTPLCTPNFSAQVQTMASAISTTGLDRQSSLMLANETVLRRLENEFAAISEQQANRLQKFTEIKKMIESVKWRIFPGHHFINCLLFSWVSRLIVRNPLTFVLASSASSKIKTKTFFTLLAEQTCQCSTNVTPSGVSDLDTSSSLKAITDSYVTSYTNYFYEFAEEYFFGEMGNYISLPWSSWNSWKCWATCGASIGFHFLAFIFLHFLLEKCYAPRKLHQLLNICVILYHFDLSSVISNSPIEIILFELLSCTISVFAINVILSKLTHRSLSRRYSKISEEQKSDSDDVDFDKILSHIRIFETLAKLTAVFGALISGIGLSSLQLFSDLLLDT